VAFEEGVRKGHEGGSERASTKGAHYRISRERLTHQNLGELGRQYLSLVPP
jgi:hypothetical protein